MGRFVNPGSGAFRAALNSKIYVDKTGLLEYTNSVLNSTNVTVVPVDLESLLQLICSLHIIAKAVILLRCSKNWRLAEILISGDT